MIMFSRHRVDSSLQSVVSWLPTFVLLSEVYCIYIYIFFGGGDE